MRVLVLDDNPDDRQLAVRELRAVYPDAEIVEPIDLAALDRALSEARPSLVITDLDLRWTSGQHILVTVKSRYPECPVVMFTGSGSETVAVDLMKAGLDDYVVKSPRQLQRLRASIRIAMEASAARRGLSEREAQLAAALAHQKVVVQELHHRVKNNLQVITSLLQLRARRASAEAAAELEELASRIQALSLVQAKIYATDTLDSVDFTAAIADIAERLRGVYGNENVRLEQDFRAPLHLDVGRAMPLGLLCYEIILNALKHAWPQHRPGTLTLATAASEEGGAQIVIRDDGVGFVQGEVTKGLGTQLVRALAAESRAQIGTETHPGQGTTVTLRLL